MALSSLPVTVCLLATAGLLAPGLASPAPNTILINAAVDELLASANHLVSQQGKASLPLPPLSTDWHERWHFIKVSGTVKCDAGSVGDLSSLRRTGDATFTVDGPTVRLKAALGLGSLKAHFDHCQAKVHRLFSASSKVDVSVDSESIELEASFTYPAGAPCSAAVQSVSLSQLGRFHIDLGGNVFKRVANRLLDMVANHMRDKIKAQVSQLLTQKASEAMALKATALCNKIPH